MLNIGSRVAAIILLAPLLASTRPYCIAQIAPVRTPPAKGVYTLNSQVNWIAFRPNSTDLAVALYGTNGNGKAVVFKSWLNKQNRDVVVDTMPFPCFTVAFSPDGSRLAWCSWATGKQIRVVGDFGDTRSIDCGKARITAVTFDPANRATLASVADDGFVRIWDCNTRRLVRRLLPSGGARGLSIAYSPDGRRLAATFKNNNAYVWSSDDLSSPPLSLIGHAAQVNFAAFSPDGHWIATASADKTVVLWDSASGRPIHTLDQQHLDPVTCLAFSPDSSCLASGDKSGKVVIWSVETFRPVSSFFPHRQAVYGLAISSDGEWMATGSQDKTVRFFSTRDLAYRSGRVRLAGMMPNMGLRVDGEPAALDGSATLVLSPGPHTVAATSEDGSNTREYTVDVPTGAETSLTVDVRSAYGKLEVVSDQPANLEISSGGFALKATSNQIIDRLTPGTYRVNITPRDSKYQRSVQTVEVKAAEIVRLIATARRAVADTSRPADGLAIRQTRTNPTDGAEMVWIPAGTFVMGRKAADRDARPPHPVTLTGYWIYRSPVSVTQYRKYCEASRGTAWEHEMPPPPAWGWVDDHPMVLISWQDAVDYGRWAFSDNQRLFLPTEAQYERAMQGPDGLEYAWGRLFNAESSVNSVRPNHLSGTQSIGLYAENGFGLLDIAGNVWEWCLDRYDADYYRGSPAGNPVGAVSGRQRVRRGGAWNSGNMRMFRTDFRSKADPEIPSPDTGFRCAAG